MSFWLDEPSEQPLFTLMPDLPASFGERFTAARTATTIETNSLGSVSAPIEMEQLARIEARLPPGAFELDRNLVEAIGRDRALDFSQDQLFAAARVAFDSDPNAFADLPRSPEDVRAAATRQMQADLQEAQDVLGRAPEGSWGAEVLGGLASGVLDDPVTLMMLPLGAGAGSIARVVAAEAALGVAGEALTLPGQYAQAERLGIDDPNPLLQLTIAGATSGALGGAIAGAPRALSFGRNVAAAGAQRFGAYLTARQQAARLPPGVTPLEHERMMDAGLDALEARARGEPVDPSLFPPAADGRVSAVPDAVPALPQSAFDQTGVLPEALTALASLEQISGRTFRINSAHRTPAENQAAGGARFSQHMNGRAFDIDVSDLSEAERAALIRQAREAGFGGIGVYRNSLHFDTGPVRAWGASYHADSIPGWAREALETPLGTGGPSPLGRPLQITDFDFGASGNASRTVNPVGYTVGRLMADGMPDHIAAGFVANLMAESGPTLAPGAIGDGGNALGIAQWNGPRRRALEAYAAAQGRPATDIDLQLQFLWHELRTSHRAEYAQIMRSTTAEEAARIISAVFLRPSIPHIDRRVGYARDIWRQMQGGRVPRWQSTTPLDSAPGNFGPTQRGYTGDGQLRYGDDERIDIDYVVADARLLQQATGDLQPRDRSQARSDLWVSQTAARLDPALLMFSPTADRGAPVVGPDNIIESGNGRVLAIRRVYEQFPDRAQAYRAEIERAGFTIPPVIAEPVLVARRRTEFTPDQRRDFVVKAQDSGVAQMTAAERARVGQQALTADVLSRFRTGEKLASAANRDFARAFVDAFPPSQQGQMIGSDKALSTDGVRQLRDAIFARAWTADDILRRYIEEDPGELKSLLDALATAAPDFAMLRSAIDAGNVRADMDITPFIIDAVRLIMSARDIAAQSDKRVASMVDELLADVDLMDGAVAPLTQALVRFMMPGGKQAPAERIAAFLSRYAREAVASGQTGGFLADTVGPIDVLKRIDPQAFGDLTETGTAKPAAPPAPARLDDQVLAAFDEGAASPAAVEADAIMAADLREASRAEVARPITQLTTMDPAAQRQMMANLIAGQPFDNMDSLMLAAARNHDALNQALARVATDRGLPFKPAPLKKRARVEEKVANKYAGNLRKITDVARAGITPRSIDEADAIMDALARQFELIDEGWNVTEAGYFDRKIMVRFDDGQLGELQMWPPGMIEAKSDGGGHHLYGIWRDPSVPQAQRDKALAEMQALYGKVARGLDPSFAQKLGFDAPAAASQSDASVPLSSTARSSESTSTAVSRDAGDQLLPVQTDATPSSDTAASSVASKRNSFMGDTSDEQIGSAPDAVNGRLSSADRRMLADLQVELPDGTTVRATDILDDLDADDDLVAAIDACLIGGAA